MAEGVSLLDCTVIATCCLVLGNYQKYQCHHHDHNYYFIPPAEFTWTATLKAGWLKAWYLNRPAGGANRAWVKLKTTAVLKYTKDLEVH